MLGSTTDGPSNDVEAGMIFQQSPLPLTAVPRGTLVDVVVSTGPEMVTVPDVSTQCLAVGGARQALSAVGLVMELSTDTAPANPACPNLSRIVGADPAGGRAGPVRIDRDRVPGLGRAAHAVTMWFATE